MATKKTAPKNTTKANKPASTAAPKPTRRTPEELEAAQQRAEAKGREIDERQAKSKAEPEPKAKPSKKSKATTAGATKPKKLSLLAAAYRVLKDAGTPLSCKAIVEAAGRKGLWTSPNGQTPHATLYSAILREIATKGEAARFQKVDRGQFAAV